MALPDLPDRVLNSSFHRDFFARGLQEVDYQDLQILKVYTSRSLFAKSYGFKLGGQRHHCRYTFDELGLATQFTIFERGSIEFERRIDFYRNKFTPNDILISLANVISGIYKIPVGGLFFNSRVDGYLDGLPARLFDFLADEWNIDLGDNREFDDFEELVGTLVLFLKTQRVKDPRVLRNGN
ncbi:hypothetical protein [Imperialibacter roseus]|uniref:Uncharacterized protein n=1 Tax=Imperialibacter roseus TaxID=1324217 RepID=A0ABZ0IQB1_9BACT|nr:hypothetical protein [Imperialibacter roseus]WOK05767.1 hypothetical protein RT717_22080 [Imperialibacter roseus]|tara:strand:+ start:43166 stop:43711 length:546 start_codon:yes stop_codon:yes gene_type:complete